MTTSSTKNQNLKRPVEFFEEYLKLFGTLEKDYVLININHFKRAQYGEKLKEFLEKVEPYYHKSKKKYVTRPKMNYMNFITVLRQISHMNCIVIDYTVKYTNSKHYIEYYFYIHRKDKDKDLVKETVSASASDLKIESKELLGPNV